MICANGALILNDKKKLYIMKELIKYTFKYHRCFKKI